MSGPTPNPHRRPFELAHNDASERRLSMAADSRSTLEVSL